MDRNDRISLSWQQFVWATAVLVTVILTWQNLSNRLAIVERTVMGYYNKSEIDSMKREGDLIHADHDRRLQRIEGRR